MSHDEKEANIWFYSRDVGISALLSSSSTGTAKAFKHWAIVLDYMSIKDPNRVNKRVLYEANNESGLLVAREVQHGDDEDDEWKQSSGFFKEDHGRVTITEARAKSYCDDFNQRQVKYVATKDNCQRFVDDFIANVLPDSCISLPITIQKATSWFGLASSTLSKSLSNVGSAAIVRDSLIQSRVGAHEFLLKNTIKTIDLNGFGKISLVLTKEI